MELHQEKIETAIHDLLTAMGVDPREEPYVGTPGRYYRFLKELYGSEDEEIKTFPEDYCGPIALTGHQVWSMCPHHLLPVHFVIDVTYTARDCKVLGLSKLPRLINRVVNMGPALQEKMTKDIVEALKPYAIAVHVIVRGEHLCTKMRGVKSTGQMVTEDMWQEQQPQIARAIPRGGFRQR